MAAWRCVRGPHGREWAKKGGYQNAASEKKTITVTFFCSFMCRRGGGRRQEVLRRSTIEAHTNFSEAIH